MHFFFFLLLLVCTVHNSLRASRDENKLPLYMSHECVPVCVLRFASGPCQDARCALSPIVNIGAFLRFIEPSEFKTLLNNCRS